MYSLSSTVHVIIGRKSDSVDSVGATDQVMEMTSV